MKIWNLVTGESMSVPHWFQENPLIKRFIGCHTSLRCAPARWHHGWGRFPVHRPRPPHRQGSTCRSKDSRPWPWSWTCIEPWGYHETIVQQVKWKVEVFRQRSLPPELIPILSCQVTASFFLEWKIQNPHTLLKHSTITPNKAWQDHKKAISGKRTRILPEKEPRLFVVDFRNTIQGDCRPFEWDWARLQLGPFCLFRPLACHTTRWPSTIAAPCSRIYLRTWLCLPSSNFNLHFPIGVLDVSSHLVTLPMDLTLSIYHHLSTGL